MTATSLADIVKAYDVRGTVPDQLDTRVTRALGAAFAEVVVRGERRPVRRGESGDVGDAARDDVALPRCVS